MSPFKGWSDVQVHDLTAKVGGSACQPPPTQAIGKTQTGLEGETTLNLTQGQNDTFRKAVFPKVLEKFMSPFKGWSDVQVHYLTAKTCRSACQPPSTQALGKNSNRIAGGDDPKSQTAVERKFLQKRT